MLTFDESQLREQMAQYVRKHADDDEYGPRAAFRICQALAKSPWAYESQMSSGDDSIIFTQMDTEAIVSVLKAIGDELIYGSQIATMFGTEIQKLADGLEAYYSSGQDYNSCRDEVDRALGLE